MKIKDWIKECEDYFPVGKGWKPLVMKLAKDIAEIENVEVLQVKEKFGGLRFYIGSYRNDRIDDLISKAEEESYKICEECGARENVETKGSWLLTLCKKCRGENEKKNS